MKKHCLLTTFVALALCAICFVLFPTEAKAASKDNLNFGLNEDGNSYYVSGWHISGWNSSFSGALEIPATYNGKPVTGIYEGALDYCSDLTRITIPDSVTSIGEGAFAGCSSLTSIQVSADNPNYSSDAKGVLFNKDQTVLICVPGGFSGSYTIPDSVTSIADSAFKGCSKLTSISIPDGVTSIGSSAFYNCSSLTGITIPDGVTNIENGAFQYCESLTCITIPNSITSISTYAFDGCTSLIYNYFDNAKYLGNERNPYVALVEAASDEITTCQIHEDTKLICNNAFADCDSLTSIAIPNSVTSIGISAFYDCDILTYVTIGNSVSSIGNGAFYGCYDLTVVYITDPSAWCSINFGSYDSNPMEYAEMLCILDSYGNETANVVLDSTVTEIPENAFKNCANLQSITIPNSVTSIGDHAFACTNLTSVTIPKSVTSIGDYAFYGCYSLSSATIPDSITSIGSYAFRDCKSLISITIPNSVTSIGSYAFYDCNGLTSAEISDGVTSISDAMFAGCYNLRDITIPAGVTSIGEFAFCDCSSLTSITIPDGVTSIGDWAFSGCYNLACITIPDGVTSIGDGIFADCYRLIGVTIPDGVTSIGYCAFRYCKLTSITIPDGVTSIDSSAFRGCYYLTSVTIPNSVTSIGNYAFDGCEDLRDVYYSGTISKWQQVNVGSYNFSLNYDTIRYNHVHDYTLLPATSVPATCTSIGYTEYICAYGEKHRADYVPALGHVKGKNATVVAPTCEDDGYTKSSCQRCKQEIYTDYVDCLGHNFNGKITVVAPKCTEEGYTSTQCTRCTEIIRNDYTDALGHTMVYKAAVAATCTKDGNTAGTLCSRCGHLGTATKLEKGHKYKTTTTKATLSKNGSVAMKCTVCGNTVNKTIARPITFTLSTTNYTYNGQEKKPAVVVKDANGKTLVNGTDYTVTYPSGRTALGSYTVTITMKGNYSGTRTLTFNIKLGTPSVTVANATNGVKVSWNKIAGTKTYTVYRSVYSGGKWSSWTAIKTGVTGTTYTDTNLKSNANVKYTVRAFNGNFSSTYKASNSIKFLATPTVSATNAANGVKISWNAIAGAKTYTVYKSVYSRNAWSGWTAIKTGVTGTTYTDTSLKSNANVKYTVRAFNGNFSSTYKASNSIKFLATPTVTASNAANGVKITWNKITGAKSYIVYKSVYSGGKWGGWTRVATGVTGTSYTDTTVKSGANVRYTVKAINGNFTSYIKASNSSKFLATPTVKVAKATTGIKTSWNAVGSAKGYIVYRRTYTNGKWSGWTAIKTTTATSFTDTTAKKGVTYQYTVRAYNGNFKSWFVNSASIKR